MSRRILIVALLLVSATAAVAATTKDPNNTRGFEPGRMYDFLGIDSVSTFNGNLNVRIPVGQSYTIRPGFAYQFMLTYNSKVWDYELVPKDGSSFRNATPETGSNAGLGWIFGLGRILKPQLGRWYTYLAPDGSMHEFRSTALRPGDPATTGYFYTTDGSYIRANVLPPTVKPDDGTEATHFTLEMPDGTEQHFDANGVLISSVDRYGNWLHLGQDGLTWTIREGFANDTTNAVRQHTIVFENAPLNRYLAPNFQRRVKKVNLAAFNGATSTWTFHYDDTTIERGECGAGYPDVTAGSVNVPLLVQIDLPDGSSYIPMYNKADGDSACSSGTMHDLTLPTKGSIAWKHRSYDLPVETCTDLLYSQPGSAGIWTFSNTGVGTRTLKDHNGTVLQTTSYVPELQVAGSANDLRCSTKLQPAGSPLPPRVMKNTVTSLTGQKTVYSFSAFRTPDSKFAAFGPQKVEEYGLPFNRAVATTSTTSGRFLSTQVLDGSGQAIRSTYLTYASDGELTPGNLANPRPQHTLTVFDADEGDYEPVSSSDVTDTTRWRCKNAAGSGKAPCAVEAIRSDFDGFGHYRTEVTRSNFPCGQANCTAGADARTVYTDFNSGMNGTSEWNTGWPWILNTYGTSSVTERGVTRSTFTTFDGYGAITSVKTGSGSDALVSAICRNALGLVTSERWFGGRTATPANLCDPDHARSDGQYILKHFYGYTGPAITSHSARYLGAPFYSVDETLDRNTGLVSNTKDPSGLTTSYTYDTSSRLKSATPPGLVPTSYNYQSASVTGENALSPAKVSVTTTPLSTDTGNTGVVAKEYLYDGIGRLTRERSQLPGGTWSIRSSRFDLDGNVAGSSETQADTSPAPELKETTFGYDAFNRVTATIAPDTSQSWVDYAGNGVRALTRTRSYRDAPTENGIAYARTYEAYDAHGRLARITEAYGTPQAATTTYEYDPAGNLTKVTMGTQVRSFTYDSRGLLTDEQHPELGLSGNGTISYRDHDAKGHAQRKLTGAAGNTFDLSFAYDVAERLTAVRRTDGPILKEFVYDYATGEPRPDPCAGIICGRLYASARHNDVPGLGSIAVVDVWKYDATTGLPARRDVAIGSTDSFTGRSFGRAQRYNSLGLVKEIDPPFDNTGAGAVRKTVKQTYAYGLLQGVTGWATLSYKPNGLIQQVAHTGGVDEIWDDDPNSMARPQKIRAVKAGVTLWSTGVYKFDGSGNIEKIDNTSYQYDPFGRLASWRKENSSQSYDQTSILYDRYGNQIASTISGCTQTGTARWLCYAPVVSAVQYSGNRVIGYTYDAAGNVLTDATGRTFAYDAFNMSVSASVAGREFRYIYDASDERMAAVERVSGADGVTRNRTTWTLRGFGNELLSVFSDDATTGTPVLTWKEDEIYRGSSLLGIDTPSGARHYALDHLGSPRLVTDAAGNKLGEQHFAPFGDGGATGSGALQFTGHERDAATIGRGAVDLPDYMHARFYDAEWGRFLSVDPGAYNTSRPQLWNRYNYCENNPLNSIDPDGRNPLGALIGGAIGVTIESARQIRSNQPVNNRKLLAALVGGAAAGAIGGLGGTSLKAAISYGAAGNVVGGMAERQIKGERVLDGNAVIIDAASGGVGGGTGFKLGTVVVSASQNAGELGELTLKAAAQRADAAAVNGGLGADTQTSRQAQALVRAMTVGGDSAGNTAGEMVKSEIQEVEQQVKRRK